MRSSFPARRGGDPGYEDNLPLISAPKFHAGAIICVNSFRAPFGVLRKRGFGASLERDIFCAFVSNIFAIKNESFQPFTGISLDVSLCNKKKEKMRQGRR